MICIAIAVDSGVFMFIACVNLGDRPHSTAGEPTGWKAVADTGLLLHYTPRDAAGCTQADTACAGCHLSAVRFRARSTCGSLERKLTRHAGHGSGVRGIERFNLCSLTTRKELRRRATGEEAIVRLCHGCPNGELRDEAVKSWTDGFFAFVGCTSP